MIWILLVLFYGLAKGVRDVVKKKALTKNTVMEVLFVYTFLAFMMCIPEAGDAIHMPRNYYLPVLLKSVVIFLAWIFSFHALDHMPISIYGVLDLSRILFATMLGVIVLHEVMSPSQVVGLMLVLCGLFLLKLFPLLMRSMQKKRYEKFVKEVAEEEKRKYGKGRSEAGMEATESAEGVSSGESTETGEESMQLRFVVMAFLSCLLNAVSGLLDKIYMKEITSSQLQFWYMLFLTLLYGAFFLVTRTRIRKNVWTNGWIWLLSFLFAAADRALFIANSYSDSRVTVMTLIKQSSCLITIAAGRFIFKEKNIGYKIICALVISAGIVIAAL
ncbi:MAG: DMT family transporter [Lachnospiraceae bacterium]|nr:DMT family transporter [Lachnospiraceae bacterium]